MENKLHIAYLNIVLDYIEQNKFYFLGRSDDLAEDKEVIDFNEFKAFLLDLDEKEHKRISEQYKEQNKALDVAFKFDLEQLKKDNQRINKEFEEFNKRFSE